MSIEITMFQLSDFYRLKICELYAGCANTKEKSINAK